MLPINSPAVSASRVLDPRLSKASPQTGRDIYLVYKEKPQKLIKHSSSSLFCSNRQVQQEDKYHSKQTGDLKDQVKETEKASKISKSKVRVTGTAR